MFFELWNFPGQKFIHWKSFGCENYKFEVIYQPAFRHRRHTVEKKRNTETKNIRRMEGKKRWGMDLGTWWIKVTFGLIWRLAISSDFFFCGACGCNEGVTKIQKDMSNRRTREKLKNFQSKMLIWDYGKVERKLQFQDLFYRIKLRFALRREIETFCCFKLMKLFLS